MGCYVVREPEGDLRLLQDRYPDRETILYYALDVQPQLDREAIHREIRRAFPNAIREDLLEQRREQAVAPGQAPELAARLRDLHGTVTGYLDQELAGYDRKDQALAKVREFIARLEEEDRRDALVGSRAPAEEE